jgi:hypothetical protein
LQYDASLTGAGIVISDISGNVIGAGSFIFPFGLKSDSSYQNTCEFIAVVVGVMSVWRLGLYNTSIRLKGDSATSLAWSESEKFHGDIALRTAVVFTQLAIRSNIEVSEIEFIPGVDNIACDKLSRGSSPLDLGFTHAQTILQDNDVNECLALCNPLQKLESIAQLSSLLSKVTRLFSYVR